MNNKNSNWKNSASYLTNESTFAQEQNIRQELQIYLITSVHKNSKQSSQIATINDFPSHLLSLFSQYLILHTHRDSMGGIRTQPLLTKQSYHKEGPNFTYAVTSMCGWRLYMEDAHISTVLSDKKTYLFAIFDGHGGPQVSNFVEKHFVEELQKNKNFKTKNYELALKETFLKMDELLRTIQGKKEIVKIQAQMRAKQNAPNYQQESHAGCTANVCLITPDIIYVANAGDSRSVYCTSKGQAKQLSKDHKPEDPIELKRIKNAGGTVDYGRVNGNLNLSRAIGDLEYKSTPNLTAENQMITANPDIMKIKNQNIDFIIMGCDGIWQVKSNVQMVNYIKKKFDEKRSMVQILENMMDQLVSKETESSEYGMDNMSAILIKFKKR